MSSCRPSDCIRTWFLAWQPSATLATLERAGLEFNFSTGKKSGMGGSPYSGVSRPEDVEKDFFMSGFMGNSILF